MRTTIQALPANSPVWVFQTTDDLSAQPTLAAELDAFIDQWTSHGANVLGAWQLMHGHFLIISAHEPASGVSGCSRDKLMHALQDIGNRLNINFFDRLQVGLLHDGRVQFVPLAEVKRNFAIYSGFQYFDLSINTLAQIREDWPMPVQNSWLAPSTKTLV